MDIKWQMYKQAISAIIIPTVKSDCIITTSFFNDRWYKIYKIL